MGGTLRVDARDAYASKKHIKPNMMYLSILTSRNVVKFGTEGGKG